MGVDSVRRKAMKLDFTWTEYLASLAKFDDYHGASDWTDGESFASAREKMAHGDDSYASMADRLLDSLSTVTDGVPVREWAPSPMGAYPVVPEFLSGMPACMRAMSSSPTELSPVRIVVSSTCSAGIDKETMTRRGVAVLALVQKLQQIRPVELVILVEGNDERGGKKNLFQLIAVDTKPLSVAHACFALANVGFARQLTYCHMNRFHGWKGDWPRDYQSSGYERIVREECGLSPEDLWLRSSHDSDGLLARDSVAWVNEQLARYAGAQD
jgi:hypothetical protein